VGALLAFLIWKLEPARLFIACGKHIPCAVFRGVVLRLPAVADGPGVALVPCRCCAMPDLRTAAADGRASRVPGTAAPLNGLQQAGWFAQSGVAGLPAWQTALNRLGAAWRVGGVA